MSKSESGSIKKRRNSTLDEDQCLKELKLMIKEDKELDTFSPFFTDTFLQHFVIGKKYKPKDAFSTLKNYIKVRKDKFPDIFKSLRPSSSMKDQSIAKILKNRDKQGCLVVVTRIKDWDPKLTPCDQLIREFVLYADELMNLENVVKTGVVNIADVSGFGLKHAITATPFHIHRLLCVFHSALPVKMKGFHIINEMQCFSIVAKSLLMLIPKKLKDRLHFHSNNVSSLHQYVSQEILPISLGGRMSDEEAYMDLNEIRERIFLKENYYIKFADKLFN